MPPTQKQLQSQLGDRAKALWERREGCIQRLAQHPASAVAVQNTQETRRSSPVFVGKDVSKEIQHPASTVIDVQNLKKTNAPTVA